MTEEVVRFNITQDDYDFTKDTSGITRVLIRHYSDTPVGYDIVLVDEFGNVLRVICARPCPNYNAPSY